MSILSPEYKISAEEMALERLKMLFAEGDIETLYQCACIAVTEKYKLLRGESVPLD